MAFSSSLEFGYVVLGQFFSLPNSLSTWQVHLRCLADRRSPSTDRRSHSPLPPGTMPSILFAKHVSFEHSVSSPHPVITSRREENNKANVFQHPIDSHSQSASSCLDQPALRGQCCRTRPRCSEFLHNRKYRYRSYTQTNDTHFWPWVTTSSCSFDFERPKTSVSPLINFSLSFYTVFTEDASLFLLHHNAKKSRKTKKSNLKRDFLAEQAFKICLLSSVQKDVMQAVVDCDSTSLLACQCFVPSACSWSPAKTSRYFQGLSLSLSLSLEWRKRMPHQNPVRCNYCIFPPISFRSLLFSSSIHSLKNCTTDFWYHFLNIVVVVWSMVGTRKTGKNQKNLQ